MTPDKLREACEVARLQVFRENVSRPWQVYVPDWGGLYFDHPALLAYVASQLVAMVSKRGDPSSDRYLFELLSQNCDVTLATDKQRITAAMKALKESR